MIPERYRKNYDGEFVVIKTTIKNGQKEQIREWIPNPIENQHISGRAAVISSGQSKRNFPLKVLERHKGGLLGSKRLQTYGCDNVWKEMKCNFYVERDATQLREMIEQKYQENSVVYTSTRNCLSMPGEFYMIPYNMFMSPVALATYIAAFDGHKEIFMVGVDALNATHGPDTAVINEINQIIKAYQSTKFYFITDGAKPYDVWLNNSNVQHWNYRTFITQCDI